MREYISREAAINKLLQCADGYDPDYSDITVAHAMSKINESGSQLQQYGRKGFS